MTCKPPNVGVNEIMTSLGWFVAIINALGEGTRVISDCYDTYTFLM